MGECNRALALLHHTLATSLSCLYINHPQNGRSDMKITGFETIPIKGRAMVLKMFTDEGVVGYGEPMNYEHWRVVAQAVDDMAEYLIGKDPLQIEDHWQAMYRSSYSRNMPVLVGALSGIEMAMWDVFGKVVNMPVWKLLGRFGAKSDSRLYRHRWHNTPRVCGERDKGG